MWVLTPGGGGFLCLLDALERDKGEGANEGVELNREAEDVPLDVGGGSLGAGEGVPREPESKNDDVLGERMGELAALLLVEAACPATTGDGGGNGGSNDSEKRSFLEEDVLDEETDACRR